MQRRSIGAPNGLIESYQRIYSVMRATHEETLSDRFPEDEKDKESLNQAMLSNLNDLAMAVSKKLTLNEDKGGDGALFNNQFITDLKTREESWLQLNIQKDIFPPFDWTCEVELSAKDQDFIKQSTVKVDESLEVKCLNDISKRLQTEVEGVRGSVESTSANINALCTTMHKELFRDVNEILSGLFVF